VGVNPRTTGFFVDESFWVIDNKGAILEWKQLMIPLLGILYLHAFMSPRGYLMFSHMLEVHLTK
jgi:hypothetical protein